MENFPLNCDDIKGAEDIWGENLGFMTGKNSIRSAPHIRETLIQLPVTILHFYRDVKLAGDVMYINSIRFINTISHHIKFMTEEHIANAEASTLQNSIKQLKRIYMQWVFKVVNILMGGQFECINGDLAKLQVDLNICSNNKQMGEIERLIITIKERSCRIYNTIPFKKVPGRMIVELLALVVFNINTLPPYPSIADNFIP